MELRFSYAARTEAGNYKPQNQDSVLCLPERGFFAVADGLSEPAGGEVASAHVMKALSTQLEQWAPGEVSGDALAGLVQAANTSLLAEAHRQPHFWGMGTTIASLWTNGRSTMIANVGDSRVYEITAGHSLIQITQDHTELRRFQRPSPGLMGLFGRKQSYVRPVLANFLGARAEAAPEIHQLDGREHASFLLCTDGLIENLDDDSISSLLAGKMPDDLELAADALLQAALDSGSRDNISLLLVTLELR